MPARPPSEPPQEGWHRLLPLLAAGVPPCPSCACYFSNTAWIISQAMLVEGRWRAPPGSLLMASPTDANRPFPFTPPVYPRLRCGLNPYGIRRFYLSGTRLYLYSLTECRSPNSPLFFSVWGLWEY